MQNKALSLIFGSSFTATIILLVALLFSGCANVEAKEQQQLQDEKTALLESREPSVAKLASATGQLADDQRQLAELEEKVKSGQEDVDSALRAVCSIEEQIAKIDYKLAKTDDEKLAAHRLGEAARQCIASTLVFHQDQ